MMSEYGYDLQKVQTDSDSSSPVVEMNSATEISTDSEFEQDPIVKETPQIFIDQTHLKKPTKVQVKQGIIENGKRGSPTKLIHSPQPLEQIHLEFKPLVQVDPSVLNTNRTPLKNPRPGDYLLSKTSSTEGIASKKSLELKKRYLLGESTVPGGLMKSDSTSVLDSKFKNFHSNISECQKLLNPAPSKIPILQSPLQTTSKVPEQNTPICGNHKIVSVKDSEEKENVYGDLVQTKNRLNSTEIPEPPKTLNILDLNESGEQVLSDSKTPVTPQIIETIDLVTPEKPKSIDVHVIRAEMEVAKKAVTKSRDKIDKKSDSGCEIIDLTNDTPEKDRSVNEQLTDNKIVDVKYSDNDNVEIITLAERNKNAIDSMLKRCDYRKSKSVEEEIPPRSPVYETSIEVPRIPWNSKSSKTDVESDSLSSSTTSSVDDIPHYILDSTTSPDTLPGDRFVPRLEIRDTSGELMQIDSLMIIDGKYVGDPEDLKHMKMPDGSSIPESPAKPLISPVGEILGQSNVSSPAAATTPVKEPKVHFVEKCDKSDVVNESKPIHPLPSYKYESKKFDLKFDTKNENKIDTLRNIPLVMPPKEEQKPIKPSILLLNNETNPGIEKTIQTPTGSTPEFIDMDKTPTAATVSEMGLSDSETEVTGPVLTETELSDWNADDAVSENFVDIEFVLNSNKGTIKRNKKSKKKNHTNLVNQATRNATEMACPLAKDLDFDGIEFMDTGSEDSCLETYSATNKALLKNRGYVKFVDNYSNKNIDHINVGLSYKSDAGYGSSPKDLSDKSPKPPPFSSFHEAVNTEVSGIDYIEQGACILGNDIDLKTPMNESPSIFTIKNPFDQKQQQLDSLNDMEEDSLLMIASQGTTTATTTEDSDALTIVTSPVDSTPKNAETPSSDKITSGSPPKNVSMEVVSSSGGGGTDDSPVAAVLNNHSSKYLSSQDEEDLINRPPPKDADEYGEYVRKLQMKITKISNARDSIDVRKTKRKHSKGDITGSGEQLNNSVIDNNKSLSIYKAVEEPSTVMERIERISKERTKQKDLIHDLVMDKLQSKKQLNAEKRLNRSRNRSIIFSPLGGSMSTTPSSGGDSFTVPHCHPVEGNSKDVDRRSNVYASSHTPSKSNFFTPQSKNVIATKSSKDRPLSDHLEKVSLSEPPRITKTQSFCVYSARNIPNKFSDNNVNGFSTPIAPLRRKPDDSTLTQTERLRQDARARARMKSNQDLGLSPDEKMQLLRKRLHLDGIESGGNSLNKSDDMKVRERKMMASKSVNDIRAGGHEGEDRRLAVTKQYKLNDFISDPNLLEQDQRVTKRNGRQKDPDRRKSIIKTVSDFFNKKKDKDSSPAKEKNSDGVFGLFRISPKAKSKSCFDLRNFGFGEKIDHPSQYERSKSENCLEIKNNVPSMHSPYGYSDEVAPPIPPLPLNYQRSDDESCSPNENRDLRKLRAMTKASRQAELKRLRIAQEIQREQEEIEVKLKDLEARGVVIEKALRGEGQNIGDLTSGSLATDDSLLKELLEIWRNITQLKKRDDELGIRQQELKLEHRHAQLKEQLNTRLSSSKLDKSSSDVAAEGAILNEMLEIVAKRATLRPSDSVIGQQQQRRSSHDAIESDI